MEVNKVYNENCLETMKRMPDNFVDSIVTDPPYGISFMGKEWDSFDPKYQKVQMERESKRKPRTDGRKATGFQESVYAGLYDLTPKGMVRFQAWYCEIMQECLRVLKPGGHVLSFGSPRTYHRMACAIEDAGFEIRDQLQWIFGSGFPKSLNLGEGWGTGLKPANEPICLARKPLSEKTVAANVLRWGTGGINIDGCRVETNPEVDDKRLGGNGSWQTDKGMVKNVYAGGFVGTPVESSPLGRFPANVIHDGSDEVLRGFPDSTSGEMDSMSQGKNYGIYGKYNGKHVVSKASSGSAARFFYVPKADKQERNDGLYQFEDKYLAGGNQAKAELERGNLDFKGEKYGNSTWNQVNKVKNNHPTVKPVKLIQYLIRLVTPKGGVSYDPFGGSGTHPIASQNEGVNWIMSEMVAEYCDIANKRIYNNGGLFL